MVNARSKSRYSSKIAGVVAATLSLVLLGGCAIRNIGPELKVGAQETAAYPVAVGDTAPKEYSIGPFDTINVNVFQQPDLTVEGVQVDAAGRINLALIGQVTASGKTALELSREIERLYGARYLVNPQINVSVTSSISQKVVVQGEVGKPGVYPIKGPTTLLEAISLAEGETDVAALNQVVVLRTVNGQKMGAIFDVASIRRREAEDPSIFGNDVVIVGFANARGLWRDVLKSAPLLNGFYLIRR